MDKWEISPREEMEIKEMWDAEECQACEAYRMERVAPYCPDHARCELCGTYGKHAHCTKCGEPVLGDEDGICSNCI